MTTPKKIESKFNPRDTLDKKRHMNLDIKLDHMSRKITNQFQSVGGSLSNIGGLYTVLLGICSYFVGSLVSFHTYNLLLSDVYMTKAGHRSKTGGTTGQGLVVNGDKEEVHPPAS